MNSGRSRRTSAERYRTLVGEVWEADGNGIRMNRKKIEE